MRRLSVIALCLALPGLAAACLWDHETLSQERSRFPSALELITGKFLRHSPEYYRWRIADRTAKLKDRPGDMLLTDDLAVAHDKLGEHARAIELAREQLKAAPDRYETVANLGTFLIHAGEHREGLALIDRALALNPDAHFGRERVQKWLVEYQLEKPADKWPKSFTQFLDEKGVPAEEAIKGVLGIMRFSKHDSTFLLKTLGDLGRSPIDPKIDARQLAARAFLKAGLRDRAREALLFQITSGTDHEQLTLEAVEAEFALEQADADAWYAKLRADELRWIAEGRDVDAEFAKLYAADPEVNSPNNAPPPPPPGGPLSWLRLGVGEVVILAVLALLLFGRGLFRR